MRHGSSVHRFRQLQVASAAVVAGDDVAERWPAWASLLLVLGAGLASWTAVILTASTAAG